MGKGERMMIKGESVCAPYSSGSNPPKTAAPDGATDCHVHIFDRRFPRPAGRDGPDSSDVAALLRLRLRLGLSRAVLVYPSSYGGDNRAMLDALEQLGDTARGVAYITPQITDAELDRMNSAGVRGARLYLARDNPPDVDDIRAYAYRLASRGWHLEFVVRERQLMDAEAVLMALPCKIVLCHFAHLARPLSMRPPGAERTRSSACSTGGTPISSCQGYTRFRMAQQAMSIWILSPRNSSLRPRSECCGAQTGRIPRFEAHGRTERNCSICWPGGLPIIRPANGSSSITRPHCIGRRDKKHWAGMRMRLLRAHPALWAYLADLSS